MYFLFFLFSSGGVSELSGLLKAQHGVLSSYKIMPDNGDQKGVMKSSPQILVNSSSQPVSPFPSTVQSPMVIGNSDEPLIAYKLEDYNKKFGAAQNEPEAASPKPTITIEGLLRNSKLISSEVTPNTSTPISSLLSLARHMPSVQLTTTSSVSNQIQQLLSCLAKSSNISSTTGSLPSTVLTPLKIPSCQSAVNEPLGLLPNPSTPSTGYPVTSVIQSGSPLQNSVPTLMSSLTKTTSITGGNMIKIMTSPNSSADELKGPAIQKLQFPESSLSTLSQFASITESSVLSQKLIPDGKCLAASNITKSQPQIQITVNKSNAYAVQSSTLLDTSGFNQISSLSKPILISDAGETFTVPQKSDVLVSYSNIQSRLPETNNSLSYGGHSYSASPVETLGKVSSMLESSPITEYASHTSMRTASANTISTAALSHQWTNVPQSGGLNVCSPATSHRPTPTRASPNVTVSYTATAKQSLSSTRTRRIRTPKQFDL